VDPALPREKVLRAVEDDLRARFGFAARDFGQAVHLSEVIAAIQAIEGVRAVAVDALYRDDQPAGPNAHLAAALPVWGADTVSAAELLTLDPRPLDLKTMA
jgi:hypothetical protein